MQFQSFYGKVTFLIKREKKEFMKVAEYNIAFTIIIINSVNYDLCIWQMQQRKSATKSLLTRNKRKMQPTH